MTPAWHSNALCRLVIAAGRFKKDGPQIKPEHWVNAWYAPTGTLDHHLALEVCAECPVYELCAMQGDDERYGIWGGKYRDKYPKADPADPIVHGTEAGASRHRRRNEKPCRECQDAANRANQTRKDAVA